MPIILGIDPGSRKTGYGLIHAKGQELLYLACGQILTHDADFPQRLRIIFQGIEGVINEFEPDQAAIEDVFMMPRNPSAALKLGQARGAAMVPVSLKAIEIAEYSPRRIKQTVVGFGGADKQQIQHMVSRLLNLSKVPPEDAADALAVAICHAYHAMHPQLALMQSRGRSRRVKRRQVKPN